MAAAAQIPPPIETIGFSSFAVQPIQARLNRLIQRRQTKQEARKQYYELQSKMDELLNDNPEFKEM